jgi:hypothetical protein
MWSGTYAGINRYDGYNFKVYKAEPGNPNSLSNYNVECLIEDHLGIMRYIHYPDNPESLSHNNVLSVMEDRQPGLA